MINFGFHFWKHALLWIGLGVFALTILFVNTFRETAVQDDWAYALTVKHLLETGKYQLHDWAAANMPFQIYYGALFSAIAGYSFSILRISTLILAFVALIAFYFLAREHGLDYNQSGLLMLALLASPLFLQYSFSFMTDVPFLSCLIVALLFYTRAIRLHSYPWMLLASIAASAAILTRQFGSAIIPGVFFLWALGSERKKKAMFFSAGLVLPIIASIWQLYTSITTPNWMAQYYMHRQSDYLADTVDILINIIWRPTVILQYLAFFSIPLVFLALLAFTFELKQAMFNKKESRFSKLKVILPMVLTAYILFGIIYGHFANDLPLFMPQIFEWNFEFLQGIGNLERGVLTLITSIGAILFARIFLLRYSSCQGWRTVSTNGRLIDLVTFFLLISHLIYIQIGDRYFLVFLPYTLIAVGLHLGKWMNRFNFTTAIACLIMLVFSTIWTRGILERSEAYWKGGEFVRSIGMKPNQIHGDWTWNSYYRFSDYVAEVRDHPLNDFNYDLVSDYFYHWLEEQREHAQFWILDTEALDNTPPPADEKWEVLKEIPYKDIFFRERRVYVVRIRRGVNKAYYFFIRNLNNAIIDTPKNNWVVINSFNINNDIRPVLFEHPPSQITYKLTLPKRVSLSFGIALNPKTWSADKGDGVLFELYMRDGSISERVFSKYIDPKHNVADRKWHDEVVDLSKYGGKEVSLSFVTTPGFNNNTNFDWAGWSNPTLISIN